MNMIRKTIYFAGRVQGVGFRETARHVARGYAVTGYVRNLPDRRVELVVEGEQQEIERFVAGITEKMEGFIKSQTHGTSQATAEFSDFHVKR